MEIFNQLTNCVIIEDFRITTIRIFASKLPAVEKRLPVDKWSKDIQIIVFKRFLSEKRRLNWIIINPINLIGLKKE